MLMMCVEITLMVPVEANTEEEAEELLRNTDDAELWAIAESIEHDYYLV